MNATDTKPLQSTDGPGGGRRMQSPSLTLRRAGGAIALVLVAVAIVGLIDWPSRSTSSPTSEEIEEKRREAAARDTVIKWLEEQHKGRHSTSACWVDKAERPILLAVRGWEIIDVITWKDDPQSRGWKVAGALVVVRIDSSNEAGHPISALWRFRLHNNTRGRMHIAAFQTQTATNRFGWE